MTRPWRRRVGDLVSDATSSPTDVAGSSLRERAERILRDDAAPAPESFEALSPEAARLLRRELRVRQVELELQGEELRRVQAELGAANARYFDLYDLAPVGYCTVSGTGLIVDANVTLATLLGVTRGALAEQPLSRFIGETAAAEWETFCQRLLSSGEPQSCEVRMLRHDGAYFWAHVAATTTTDRDGVRELHLVLSDITERKRSEQALVASAEMLERSGEIAQVGGWEHDLRTRRVFWSRETCRIHEVDPSFTPALDVAINFYDPEARPVIQAAVEAAIASGTPWDLELPMITAKGRPVWVRTQGFAAMENGRAVRLFGAFHDITARRRAEIERQVMHEIAQSIATTADLDDLLHLMHHSLKRVLDAENFFVALHDRRTGLFSFPYFVDQFDSTPPPSAIPKSCTAYVFRGGEPALITKSVFKQLQERDEVALVGSNSPSWMGVPLRTPSGTIGVLVLQHYEKEDVYSERDLTFLADVGSQAAVVIERKQADAALRESEAELNVILESTADGILAVDDRGKVIKTNRRFAEMWRIPQSVLASGDDDALLGHVLGQLTDPEVFLAKVRSLYGSADEDRDTLHFKDGRVFERYSSPIVRDGGNVGRVWSFHDITARMRAETAAASLEAQLRHSQRLESVGLLAGGVSHEFNNLLAVILGNTELALLQVPPEEPLHNDLLEVQKAAQRSAALTKQLLAFARRQPVEPRELELNGIVSGTLTMLQRLIGEDIHVVWRPGERLWQVTMDPTLLDQILMNLCVNARHAIEDVGTLTIATCNCVIDADFCASHTDAVAGEYVRLAVTNTGSGRDAATVGRIFEPFYTTKEVGKGTGLGLAMVYGAVTQTGGFITVASAPGVGTTFEVYLPRQPNG